MGLEIIVIAILFAMTTTPFGLATFHKLVENTVGAGCLLSVSYIGLTDANDCSYPSDPRRNFWDRLIIARHLT